MNNDDPKIVACWTSACQAQKNAYAPYSTYFVGAALLTRQSDKIFSGCNVENASYGATICAERTAVFSAVAELGKIEITDLVVVTREPAPPCGMCLQVLSEFVTPETRIFLATADKIFHKHAFKDFLPLQFSPEHLHND